MKFGTFLKRVLVFSRPVETHIFEMNVSDSKVNYDVRTEKMAVVPEISRHIEENLEYIKRRFRYPYNNDVVIRKFMIRGKRSCFIVFYDGMVNTQSVDQDIIKTLMGIPLLSEEKEMEAADIIEQFVSHSQAMSDKSFDNIIDEVNFGACGLFVDGFNEGFILDVRSWDHRSIDKPETEQSIYGPYEAFAEMLRANSALVRKIIKTEKLICEGIKVGNVSKTRGVMMYISDLANNELVDEVRKRLEGISIDYCIAVEEVAMLIEESNYVVTSRIVATERPDRVAKALSEGRVAFLLSGSPHALIFPTNAFELMHAASDAYLRIPYANMTRTIRIVAMLLSVLLPALYLAITLFHQEMVPTFLMYAISASRESVPFPTIVEMLLMDISFEMIREAGIRMPNPIGSTLGIVGGLILGQAAVSAKIVSPIMIIVIALTGLGSFATPDYSLNWTNRILRLIFIILAGFAGFYGIGIGIFLYSIFLGAQTSFGVPFLAPLAERKKGSLGKSIFVAPIWKKEERPDYLHVKRKQQEPKISMKWKTKKK